MRWNHLSSSITLILLIAFALGGPVPQAKADLPNRVGQLNVDFPGVEIRRTNTDTWIPIKVESIVGVGDGIRTKSSGRATIRFFDGLFKVQLSPDTEIALDTFNGLPESFTLAVSVKRGFVHQGSGRTFTDLTAFQIVTPGFRASVLQGESDTRVEDNGRSAVITASGGHLSVNGTDKKPADIPGVSGVRAAVGEPVSEVVPARSFTALDIALDGCPSEVNVDGDTRLNVRLGADLGFQRIGGLDTRTAVQVMGLSNSGGWYRIRYRGGYGWIATQKLPLPTSCTDLRLFPDKFGPEDASLYKDLSDIIKIEPTAATTPAK